MPPFPGDRFLCSFSHIFAGGYSAGYYRCAARRGASWPGVRHMALLGAGAGGRGGRRGCERGVAASPLTPTRLCCRAVPPRPRVARCCPRPHARTPARPHARSYKWAEVLSADAFAAFEEAGLGDDAAVVSTGRRFRCAAASKYTRGVRRGTARCVPWFSWLAWLAHHTTRRRPRARVHSPHAPHRDTVLALGGSKPPADVFRAFRGREPSTEALLRHSGLTKTATAA
jgi:hypothetical protein